MGIQRYLIAGTNHICHSERSPRGEPLKVACRGGRNYQLQIYYRLGFIAEPTDEALALAMKEALSGGQAGQSPGPC